MGTANMLNSDKELVEYMETKFDLGTRKEEDAAFQELDKKLQRERKLLQLKQQKKEEAEQKKLEEEAKAAVEKELGIAPQKMEEKESITVEESDPESATG